MATLPASVVDPVAAAIFASYKAKYGAELQRPYLGASAIGKPCLRQHWYSFRWSKQRLGLTFQSRNFLLKLILKSDKMILVNISTKQFHLAGRYLLQAVKILTYSHTEITRGLRVFI
jgi:hypothetical protein